MRQHLEKLTILVYLVLASLSASCNHRLNAQGVIIPQKEKDSINVPQPGRDSRSEKRAGPPVAIISEISESYKTDNKELALYQKAKKDNNIQAKKELIKLASQENKKAQYFLGVMHFNGHGGPEINHVKARELLEKAAEQRYLAAQFFLGAMRFNSQRGPEINHTKDIELWEKAAEQGYPAAQYGLGVMYFNGLGSLEINHAKSRELLEKAAEQGYLAAQFFLGAMHFNGLGGLVVNYHKARELFKKAAEKGNKAAQYSLEAMNFNSQEEGLGIIQTAERIEEDIPTHEEIDTFLYQNIAGLIDISDLIPVFGSIH